MLKIAIQNERFTRLLSQLGPEGRSRVHGAMAQGLYTLLRQHFHAESKQRHATAHRLGASPTGHLESVTLSTQADASGGFVGIASPGIRRALGPLHIRPRNASALTIPIAAESYGKRAGQLARQGWDIFRGKTRVGRDILFGRNAAGKVRMLYVLRASVLIPQDRSLLPTDAAMRNAAGEGVYTLLRNVRDRAKQ